MKLVRKLLAPKTWIDGSFFLSFQKVSFAKLLARIVSFSISIINFFIAESVVNQSPFIFQRIKRVFRAFGCWITFLFSSANCSSDRFDSLTFVCFNVIPARIRILHLVSLFFSMDTH